MQIPQPHNNYTNLKQQLQADALVRVRAMVSSDPDLACLCDIRDIDSDWVQLEFADPVWRGSYPVPEWAGLDLSDGGGMSFRVIYDWNEATVTVECV